MRQGDQAGAKEALEEAVRYFETDSIPAVDQRPYVRELLAELQKQSESSITALVSDSTSCSTPLVAVGEITEAHGYWSGG